MRLVHLFLFVAILVGDWDHGWKKAKCISGINHYRHPWNLNDFRPSLKTEDFIQEDHWLTWNQRIWTCFSPLLISCCSQKDVYWKPSWRTSKQKLLVGPTTLSQNDWIWQHVKAALNDRWIQLRSSSHLRPQPILGLKRSRPLQIKALKLFKVHWTEELENFQKISSYWNCKLKVPKITFKVNRKPWKTSHKFCVEKYVLSAIGQVTTERNARKCLVMMSTFAR